MVIVFAVAAMALAWLAIFGDKPRGKARCPKCGYELGRLDSPPALPVTCPECGKKVHAPRQLQRRRIKRWPVLAAIPLAITAWIGWKLPEIDERGWLWLLPNRVVMELLPLGGWSGVFGNELDRRLGNQPWSNGNAKKTLSDDDVCVLLQHASRGNVLARPISQSWRTSYGEFVQQYHGVWYGNGLYAESPEYVAAARAAASTPSEVLATTKDRWAAGVPVRVLFEVNEWWPREYSSRVRGRWSARDSSGQSDSGTLDSDRSRSWFIAVSPKLTGPIEMTLDARVSRHEEYFGIYTRPDPAIAQLPVDDHRITLRYTAEKSIDDILVPISSPELDSNLQRIRAWMDDHEYLALDPTALGGAGVDDVAFGVRIEILCSGKLLARARVGWLGAERGRHLRAIKLWRVSPFYSMEERTPGNLTLTLTPDIAQASYLDGARQRWIGQVTLPVSIKPPDDAR